MPIYRVLGTKIPVDQYTALERYARRKGITRSEFVRRFVAPALAEVLAGRDPIAAAESAERTERAAG